MSFIDFDRIGNKLRIPKIRWGFVYIPNNFVLQKENLFTGKPVAISPGFKFFLLPGLSRAEKIEPETLDFNMQRIDIKGNQDVIFDLAITYELDGGLRYDDQQVINSSNYVSRRAWSENHGIHRYIKAFNPIQDEINTLNNQSDHTNTESKTGILESAVKDIMRRYLTGKEFDVIKKMGEKNQLITKDDPKRNEYQQAFDLKKYIDLEIYKRFQQYGLKVTNIDIKNIKQSQSVNELEEKLKAAEKNIKISELEAEAYAVKKEKESFADAQAKMRIGEAEAKAKKAMIDATTSAYAGKNVDEINAMNGNRITYHRIDLGQNSPIANGFAPTNETIARDIKQNVVNNMQEQASYEQPTTNQEQASYEQPTANQEQASYEQPTTNEEQTGYEQPTVNQEQTSYEQATENQEQAPVNSDVEIPVAESVQSEPIPDVINLPAQEILSIEDKGGMKETELFDESPIVPNDHISETKDDELFDEPVLEEKNYLSDSQIEELNYTNENTNEPAYSETFFNEIEESNNKENMDVNKEVELPELADDTTNKVSDIDILRSMKEELTAATGYDASEQVVEETNSTNNLENTIPENNVPTTVNEQPKVEEQPKGLNLDFINSTWGRK